MEEQRVLHVILGGLLSKNIHFHWAISPEVIVRTHMPDQLHYIVHYKVVIPCNTIY